MSKIFIYQFLNNTFFSAAQTRQQGQEGIEEGQGGGQGRQDTRERRQA